MAAGHAADVGGESGAALNLFTILTCIDTQDLNL